MSWIFGLGGCPRAGNGSAFQYSCLKTPRTEEAGGLVNVMEFCLTYCFQGLLVIDNNSNKTSSAALVVVTAVVM